MLGDHKLHNRAPSSIYIYIYISKYSYRITPCIMYISSATPNNLDLYDEK